jgi:hypothetical protein
VGDHILSFKSRWIELHYAPPFSDPDGQVTPQHGTRFHRVHLNYPEVAFRGASLSEPQSNPESLGNSLIVYILAHQMVVGFFYFRITIYNPDYVPSGPRARMDIDLIGVYELNKPRMGIGQESGPRLAFGAWLGPEGKRGIWIERSSNQLKRSIVAVSFDQSGSAGVPVESGDDLQELCEIAPRIESIGDVFIADSWNTNGE